MLTLNLEDQMNSKCAPPVEIGLRTLYQNLVNASPDADLHAIIRDANPARNRVLQGIFNEIESKLNQYEPKVVRDSNENNQAKQKKRFEFFTPRAPLSTLRDKLIDPPQDDATETKESDDKKYTPPAL